MFTCKKGVNDCWYYVGGDCGSKSYRLDVFGVKLHGPRSVLPSFLYTTPLTQQSPDANSTRSYRQTAKHISTGYNEQQHQTKCLDVSTSVAIAV
jgi:hypothetical protein